MENFYLMDLINAVDGSFIIGNPHLPINEIGIDTRTIKKNDIFIPIKYKDNDGCIYIKEASKTASLILIPKYYLVTELMQKEIRQFSCLL